MSGTLFVAATPIGNLFDLTPRVSAALSECDFVAAEDTRVTVKILNHLGIKKELISYHRHSDSDREDYIVGRIAGGENCVLCCDAGTPAVSDPGEQLVAAAIARGVTVTPLPGACAAITALCASGLVTSRFCFEGFLAQNRKNRRERLEQLKTEPRTMIFYEAPHKLTATLADLYACFGDRRVTLARELTKIHEEFIRTSPSKATELYEAEPPRGEFVLVVEGAPEQEQQREYDESGAVLLIDRYIENGMKPSAACKAAAADTGFDRQQLYRMYIGAKGER